VRLAVGIQQDVGWLQVAVQDISLVCVINGCRDPAQAQDGLADRNRFRAQKDGEVWSIDIVHDNEVLTLMDADFMNGNDMRVMQGARHHCFTAKTQNRICRGVISKEEHLDRDEPLQTLLPRLVNDSHAAAGDFLDYFVVAERTWMLLVLIEQRL
jgi:hypothetical protein